MGGGGLPDLQLGGGEISSPPSHPQPPRSARFVKLADLNRVKGEDPFTIHSGPVYGCISSKLNFQSFALKP